MLSAERVMQYSKLVPEVPPVAQANIPPANQPPPEWPQRGEIKLEDVSFRYSPCGPLVLKSISCQINPGEKVSHNLYLLVTFMHLQLLITENVT